MTLRKLLDRFERPYADEWWRTRAACLSADPDLFFPTGTGHPSQRQTYEAKAYCRKCPVVEACLESALSMGEAHGVWGGMSTSERRQHRAALIRPTSRRSA